MPLVSVVLPLPSSPESSTSTGARSRAANRRPQAMVSSAECVMTSSGTLLQLLEQLAPRKREGMGHFAGQNAGGVALLREKLRSQTVQIDAQSEHAQEFTSAKLRNPGGQQPRQHIPGPPLGQPGIPRGVDED